MIEEYEDELIVAEEKESDGTQDHSIQSLGSRLAHIYQEYKDARKETENEWLKDLRQYNGLYEPDVARPRLPSGRVARKGRWRRRASSYATPTERKERKHAGKRKKSQ